MATTKTRLELVNQALSNLGKLAAGQSADPEDISAVNGHVDQVLARLRIEQIIDVTDDSAIPVQWMGPLALLLADDAAQEFGLPGVPPGPGNPNPVQSAENSLRKMSYSKPTREQQIAEYF